MTDNTNSGLSRPEYLQVIIGDEVMEIETSRLGWIHRTKIIGRNSFVVKWLDDGSETLFTSRKQQTKIKKTGRNINDVSSEED